MPHHVIYNGRPRDVAATWDELSRPQLLALMGVLYGRYPDPMRQRLDALAVLLGLTPAALLRLTDVQLVEIKWLADFLFAEQLAFTRQLLPCVRPAWYRPALHGPGDGLAGVSFLEFVFADSYFMAYVQSSEDKWLYLLLATLYRPQRRPYRPRAADYAGDRRQPFNQHLLEQRVQLVARLPVAVRLAILTWYRGCRQALADRYPHVFTADNEQAARQPGGWDHVLREMSGQAFGSFQETGRQPAHQLLAKMQDDAQRAEQLKHDAETARS